jgi:diadenosine tetraphosphate (Ap4A) HIT family hydrolase
MDTCVFCEIIAGNEPASNAFQEIFHLQMHFIPRFKGDKFKINADWGLHPPREELEHLAKNIGEAFDR